MIYKKFFHCGKVGNPCSNNFSLFCTFSAWSLYVCAPSPCVSSLQVLQLFSSQSKNKTVMLTVPNCMNEFVQAWLVVSMLTYVGQPPFHRVPCISPNDRHHVRISGYRSWKEEWMIKWAVFVNEKNGKTTASAMLGVNCTYNLYVCGNRPIHLNELYQFFQEKCSNTKR